MNSIDLHRHTHCVGSTQHLPASKSISNRVLILDALAGGGSTLEFLSDANDTVLMKRLLSSKAPVLDAEDAGTTMRFLTAYFAIQPGTRTLTGTARMKQRPIGVLANALKELGAGIRYLEKDGFPPLEITGLNRQQKATLRVRGDISSQYISALMMIAPTLTEGLTIEFEGKLTSLPYLKMTEALMKQFGARVELSESRVHCDPQKYHPAKVVVEPDWSGASYWYAFVSLADEGRVLLPRLSLDSLQGDRVIADLMPQLGVVSSPEAGGLLLTKTSKSEAIQWDFRSCPDLAQTVAVACAAGGVKGHFTGLETLRIKETDRVAALQHELGKIGARLDEADGRWTLTPSSNLPTQVTIQTYEDHRMAMAFAPLSTKMNVTIENPTVVRKSYPGFWDDVQSVMGSY